jgi:hypothetical protein
MMRNRFNFGTIRFSYASLSGDGSTVRAYYGERAAEDRAEWQNEEQWELLRFIGTTEASAHAYQIQYILTQQVEIKGQSNYDNLLTAAVRKISGTWDDSLESYTSVIIDTFDVPRRVDCDGIWRGTITWRRLRG